MYRYKLIILGLIGIKSPLEKRILSNLNNLENVGLIDLMTHQLNRYKSLTHFTLPTTVWKSWIRR